MSIAKRLEEAIEKMAQGDPEGALLPVCTAIDASATKHYVEFGGHNTDFRGQAFPATRFNGRLEADPNAELGMRNERQRNTARSLRFGRDDMRRRAFAVQAEGLKEYSPGQRPG